MSGALFWPAAIAALVTASAAQGQLVLPAHGGRQTAGPCPTGGSAWLPAVQQADGRWSSVLRTTGPEGRILTEPGGRVICG